MKKLLLLAAFVTATFAQAQIQNGGFEDLNSEDFPQYWQGNLVLIGISIDSTGESHSDSVVFDTGGFTNYMLNTTDVHSGSNAVELRNGFNYTTGTPYPGSWTASSDSNAYMGFPLVLIETQAQPLSLNFYSKFFPAGADVASANVTIYDAGTNEIGGGHLAISGTSADWTAFTVPITYTSADAALFYSVAFSTFTQGGDFTMGTRLLLDDVGLQSSPLSVVDMAGTAMDLAVVPNPATGSFRIPALTASTGATIVDMSGRTQQLDRQADGSFDCTSLANGVYTVLAATANGTAHARLAVQR